MYFFFQAEDGIRYLYVTGVQTCALPIFKGAFSKSATAADSMHSTRMDTGMAGKIRLRAIATIVQENKVGNVGPPRYPLLNDRASSRIFSSAKSNNSSTPYCAGFWMIGLICV